MEDIPSVWKESASNGRPVKVPDFPLHMLSVNGATIVPDVASRRQERRDEERRTGGNLARPSAYI